MAESNRIDKALAAADHCVKCGLCLPHCPTYRLYRNENESPRGRISLAEALLRGELNPDKALRGHIDRCLLCRACENNCPSGVRYAEIIDTARAAMGGGTGAGAWIDNPLLPMAGRLARGLRIPGVLGRLARALPGDAPLPVSGTHEPAGPPRGRVGLLLGCVTRTQQAGALAASVELLNLLGFSVEVPEQQTCCGALAAHQGDLEQAHKQVAINRRAFAGVDTLVSTASACSLQLTEQLPELQPRDMVQFLAETLPDSGLRFDTPDGRVALHIPCTLHNGLHATRHLERVLEFLPGDPPTAIGNPGDCCGAGGAQMLTQRSQAVQLREPFLQRLLDLQPRYLLTENIGCALHLAEGAMARGLKIEVLHPVELLLRCLDLQGSDSIESTSTRRRFGP